MVDHRDTAHRRRWWNSIDKHKMTANVTVQDYDEGTEEDVDVPIRFEVCSCCEGRGTHVNPNIDRHGLCREDFDEDPDFAEAYQNGVYDVCCYECQGACVVPICLDEKVQEKIDQHYQALREMDAEQEAERRMGA